MFLDLVVILNMYLKLLPVLTIFTHFLIISFQGGVTIQAPQLDISTVAAGGGSRLFFENNMFLVGPESASAHPGPVRT